MNLKFGNWIKAILKPFVAGTKYETCTACETRRVFLNKFGDWMASWYARLTCSCFWKKLFKL